MRTMSCVRWTLVVLGFATVAGGCKGKAQPQGAPSEAAAPTASGAATEAPAAEAAAANTPAAVAKGVLEAFKAKDVDRLASLVAEDNRAKFREAAPKMFAATKPNIEAMRSWDGKQLAVRYAGSEAIVHFGPADGRLAVLEMDKGADGKWAWSRVRYSSAEDFAAWGSEDPDAPVPSCNGGGMHVDRRPLPAAWASRGGAPKGAVACATESPNRAKFSFEFGETPEEAAKLWREHLVANGWKIQDIPDEYGWALSASADGVELRVFTSGMVKNQGWTTVTLESPR